ncbi:MAG: DUF1501 domain-containing protein [Polyangiaceae bacterium]
MKYTSFSRRTLFRGASGLALSGLVSKFLERSALAQGVGKPAVAEHLIVLWMNGGPSHIDTWDPKSGPTGGLHKAIKTKTPGVSICEHLPKLAEMSDKLAIVRGVTHKEGNHVRAQYLMRTGYAPNPTIVHPSTGGWLAAKRGAQSGLPPFVSIGGPSLGAGFLGVQYGPFVLPKGGKGPENVALAADVDRNRFERREKLLGKMDDRFEGATGDAKVHGRRELYRKSSDLMFAPDLSSFDVSQESDATRAAFGDTDFGRGCLTAARLVESGVRCVEVVLDGWDTHVDVFGRTQKLMNAVDPAMSALLSELGRRTGKYDGKRTLLDSTLVVWMGDFGRTPKINGNEGRDHHPQSSSVVLAGAGIRTGQAYGATDDAGDKVVKDMVTIPNLMATLASPLGLDPNEMVMTPVGRPIGVTDHGAPVAALLRSANS